MSSDSVNAKDNQPKSTGSQKLTALAAIYSAAKLKSLVKSSEALVASQEKSNQILNNIDYELIKLNETNAHLEKLQVAVVSELEKKNERDRLRDEIDDRRYQIEELRKAQREAEENDLQYCKDNVYNLNREAQLLDKGSYTNVEKILLLNAMSESLSFFSEAQFKEIRDKQYLNETKDIIAHKKDVLENSLSTDEIDDYNFARMFIENNLDEEIGSIDVHLASLQKEAKNLLKLETLLSEHQEFDGKLHTKAKNLLVSLGVTL